MKRLVFTIISSLLLLAVSCEYQELQDNENINNSTETPGTDDEVEDIFSIVQSISYIPRFSDGKATMFYYNDNGEIKPKSAFFDFEIYPASAAAQLLACGEGIFAMKAIYTQPRAAVPSVDMEILSIVEEEGILSIEASGAALSEDFFSGHIAANAYLVISDGENRLSSGYINMIPEESFEKPEEPVEPEVSYGVYFPEQETNFIVDPSFSPVQTLVALRTNVEGDITVPVLLSSSVGDIFYLSPIEFVDGQAETTFTLSYPNAEVGTTYTASIKIEDPLYASNSPDVLTTLDISVLKEERWYPLGKARFFDNWCGWYIGLPVVTETEILQNELNPNKFRIMDPYGPFWALNSYTPKDAPAEYFEIRVLKEGEILWPGKESETKITLSNLIMYDPICTGYYDNTNGGTHHYYHPCNFSSTEAESAWTYNCVLGYQDNGLPTAFQIAPFPYMPGVGGWNYSTEPLVTIIFPGVFDYSLSVETDYCLDGVIPLSFELGIDIETVKYVVAAGELGLSAVKELLAGIKDGTAENVETISGDQIILDERNFVKYAKVGLTCPASGKYTLVAVGFDAGGTAQADQSVVLDYAAATDDSHAVDYTVEVTDTPARFAEKYGKHNSFSFLIYGGTELTDLKVGVYATAYVDVYGLDAIVADLRTETSVSKEALALANSLVGYNDLMTGLTPRTSYTLVVWATNGIFARVITETYKTEPNPEVFKSLGMATYTDDIVSTLFGAPTVTYQVEIQESVDNPGKYRLVNPYGEIYPYNEPGDWDADNTYYLTIDATDPDYVNLVESDLGIDWGYGPMTALSFADYFIATGWATKEELKADGYYGKLVDGVITFNVKTLGLAMGSDLYYANQLGEFKVVLPSASTDTPAEEGTETTAVKKSANLTATPFACYMSKGRVANADILPEVRTVECEISMILAPPSLSVFQRASAICAFEPRLMIYN